MDQSDAGYRDRQRHRRTLVATAPEGDVTVVWSTNRGGMSRTRQAGGGWGPVLPVNAAGVEDIGVDATRGRDRRLDPFAARASAEW